MSENTEYKYKCNKLFILVRSTECYIMNCIFVEVAH